VRNENQAPTISILIEVSSKACFGDITSDGALLEHERVHLGRNPGFSCPVPPRAQRSSFQARHSPGLPILTVQGCKELRPKNNADVSSWNDMWGCLRLAGSRHASFLWRDEATCTVTCDTGLIALRTPRTAGTRMKRSSYLLAMG
jgi:hypothetical protein